MRIFHQKILQNCFLPVALVGTVQLLASGCTTTKAAENPVTGDPMQLKAASLPKLNCPANAEPYSFIMTSVDGVLPSFDQLKLPEPKAKNPNETPSVVRPDSLDNIRLDFCVTADNVQLQRIFQVKDHVRILNVSQDAKILGLHELFFDQNYDKLEIVVPFDDKKTADAGEEQVLIIKDSDKTGAAAVATGTAVAGQVYLAQDEPIVFGTIEKDQSDVASTVEPKASDDQVR